VAAPGADPRATVVDLGRGTDLEVNLALDTYSEVSGTVTVDSRPVEHLTLVLHSPGTTQTTVTDRNGAYRFERVKAGQYVLASVTSAGRTIALTPDTTTAAVDMSPHG
jgi:hypothetical protein